MSTTLMMNEQSLSIHGINLRFTTNSQAIADSVSELLGHFTQAMRDPAGAIKIQFDAVGKREDISVRITEAARHLYSGSGVVIGDDRRNTWVCDIFSDQGRLIADFRAEGVVVIEEASAKAQGYLVRPESMQSDIRASFVHFAVMELLKRRGLYTFHATALEKDGQGILIPGYSGRGKTTAFLSLLRSGYRYLSDDHPLFRAEGERLDLLPFPMKINVTEQTVQFFPELRDASSLVLRPGAPKSYFHVEDVYPGPLGLVCQPALILFPHIIDAPHSCLELLSKQEALETILPHCLLVYDPDVARREFVALTQLVQQTDCYRLHFGRDVLDLPWLIAPLLQARQIRTRH